jgi:catechol 2,3-dioxygenase-like lactoylglutathione lyase family enzyme
MTQRHAWPHEHCANEPFGFLKRVGKVALLAALMFNLAAAGAVREVGPIELTVNDLDRELAFFTNTLPFQLLSIIATKVGAADDLLALKDTELRTSELKLGDERIRLTEHLRHKGRAIPADSRSFDHWFQHIAIVVSDMDAAYEHLRRAKAKHVSTAPQTLPSWNKDAGGIKAFYFRDPEDHVLEVIWFPPGKGDSKWQQSIAKPKSRSPLFLGIDHTAIVVSDTDKSLAFYTNVLGMRVVGEAENYGVEQEHLNQAFGARLRITALRAERGPGIEFLEYITPPGGRPLPGDAKANDLTFWQTWLHVDPLNPLEQRLHSSGARFVSRGRNTAQQIVRDPDGHALRLVAVSATTNQIARSTENR